MKNKKDYENDPLAIEARKDSRNILRARKLKKSNLTQAEKIELILGKKGGKKKGC